MSLSSVTGSAGFNIDQTNRTRPPPPPRRDGDTRNDVPDTKGPGTLPAAGSSGKVNLFA